MELSFEEMIRGGPGCILALGLEIAIMASPLVLAAAWFVYG